MALFTKQINPNAKHANLTLQNKHYQRKHGKNAYYGQKRKEN
ncbi:L-ribulose-5-phosphate 4-epimerase [Mesomycoplasma hyorhinis]|nr:L-ribulose-5-phosphate 4-epimerase [Mesomycoplasma hyorhinis]